MDWRKLFRLNRQPSTELETQKSEIVLGKRAAPIEEAVEDRWLVQSAREYTPEEIRQWIQAAEGGDTRSLYAFGDEMRARDAHLGDALDKAERKAVGGRLELLPYPAKFRTRVRGKALSGDAAMAAEVAQYCSEVVLAPSIDIGHSLKALMNGFWKGLGAFQPVLEPDGKTRYRLVEARPVPSQRFFYAPNSTQLMVRLTGQISSAVPVDGLRSGLVVFRGDSDIPNPARQGLYQCIFPFFAIRKFGPVWWCRFVEKNGNPQRQGTYPVGRIDIKEELIRSFEESGDSPWIAIPEGAVYEIKSIVTTANGDLYEGIQEWTARQISKRALGAAEPTEIGKGTGSKAWAESQGDDVLELAEGRGARVCGALREQFLVPLVAATYGPEVAHKFTPEPVFRSQRRIDILTLSQAAKNIKEAGGGEAFPLSVINELGGIPVPEEGEPTLGPPTGRPGATGMVREAFAAKPSAAAELAALEEWAVRQAKGAGAEILAPYEHILSQAEADGATLEQVYARVVQQSGIPPESPHLIDLLAAVQMEAMLRGYTRKRYH